MMRHAAWLLAERRRRNARLRQEWFDTCVCHGPPNPQRHFWLRRAGR